LTRRPDVSSDLVSKTSQLFLDLGYGGKVKVLVPGTGSYKEEFLTKPTVQAFCNYSVALSLGFPRHEKAVLFLLGNACQINPEIVDFEPVKIRDSEGKLFVVKSENLPRDHWMIAEHLRFTPYVINYPEMFEGFNVKVQQNAWDILDNPYGPNGKWVEPRKGTLHYPENLTASDKAIWDKVIIPQWQYYWNSTPQAGNLSKRITVFPWYDSSLLKQQISNETDRKIALMYLWELLPWIGDLDSRKLIHKGLNAMVYQIGQMPRLYNEIMKEYPNGTWGGFLSGEKRYYRDIYYDYIVDRGEHGLNNTMTQFIGFGINEFYDKVVKQPDNDKYIIHHYPNAINTYLSKNCSWWEMMKFIEGYGINYDGWDDLLYHRYFPIGYKAFGIPFSSRGIYSEHFIDAPARYVAGYEGTIFGLPDEVLQPLKQGKYSGVLILPGNGISPIGSPLDGIKKDLVYGQSHPVEPNAKYVEVYLPIRGNKIYFLKGGEKG